MTLTNCLPNTLPLKSGRLPGKGHSIPQASLGNSWSISAKKICFTSLLTQKFSYTELIYIHFKIGDTSVYTKVFIRNFMTFQNVKQLISKPLIIFRN